MKFINSNNRKSWIVCVISFFAAAIVFVFLPEIIPIHFTGGTPNEYVNKWSIFLFPLLQIVIVLVSDIKSVKYWYMNFKSGYAKSEIQYYFIIFCAVLIIFLGEAGVIVFSLCK